MKISTAAIKMGEAAFSLKYREDSLGDRGVIQQIFRNQDYAVQHWPQGRRLLDYHLRHSKSRPSLIVDAGANIGAASLYFSFTYPNSLIFAIEPDIMNWQLLQLNTAGRNVFSFCGAIADVDGELALLDPGRSDWGFMTAPVDEACSVPDARRTRSICPASVLSHHATEGANPLILKIDIEGGERALFAGETDWLDKFPLVIIELHDWMLPFSGASRNFIKAVSRHDFDIVHRGENIFLFNSRILGP